MLVEAGLSPRDVCLLRHKDTQARRVVRHTNCGAISWSGPGTSRILGISTATNRLRRQNETLFVGLYGVKYRGLIECDTPMLTRDDIDKAGSCDVYDLTVQEPLRDLIGRLVIDWGPAAIAWVQHADRQNKPIKELRKEFKEPDFPGFLQFIEPLSVVDRLPKHWTATLQSSRGVYLLTCPRTKEQYVGSATGEKGFWGRWQEYLANGHGGNVVLRSLEPSDYQVSILEVAGTALAENDIVKLEQRWKAKLQTRQMGLNGN